MASAEAFAAVQGRLSGDKVEQRVVGVMMLNKLLDSESSEEIAAGWISTALKLVDKRFILKMIETEDETGRSIPIQTAGLTLLAYACSTPRNAKVFLGQEGQLVKACIATQNADVRAQITTALKLLVMASGSSSRESALKGLLDCASIGHSDTPQQLLQLAAEIATAESAEDRDRGRGGDPVVLSEAHSATLRSLMVQGLHGAAPECVRDGTLSCCRDLLNSALSPLWTTSSGDAGKSLKDAFPLLLCSIVRGELVLLCDELLFLATNSEASLEERQREEIDVSKRPGAAGAGAEGEAAGLSAASSAVPAATTAPAATSVADAGVQADVNFFRSRIPRTRRMHATCLQLLDLVLLLLVGRDTDTNVDTDADINADADVDAPAWGDLPHQTMLQIKQRIYGTLEELMVFVRDCAGSMGPASAGSDNDKSEDKSGIEKSDKFITLAILRSSVCAVVDTVARFTAEDPELQALLLKSLPFTAQCSVLGTSGVLGELGVGEIGDSGLLLALVRFGRGPFDLHEHIQMTSETDATKATVAASSGGTGEYEVLLHLAAPLSAIASEALEASESDHLEGLFDAFAELLPRYVGLLDYGCRAVQKLVGQGGQGGQGQHKRLEGHRGQGTQEGQEHSARELSCLLSALTQLALLVDQLVRCREAQFPGELALLLLGDGDDAVLSQIGVAAPVLRGVFLLLTETVENISMGGFFAIGAGAGLGAGTDVEAEVEADELRDNVAALADAVASLITCIC